MGLERKSCHRLGRVQFEAPVPSPGRPAGAAGMQGWWSSGLGAFEVWTGDPKRRKCTHRALARHSFSAGSSVVARGLVSPRGPEPPSVSMSLNTSEEGGENQGSRNRSQ